MILTTNQQISNKHSHSKSHPAPYCKVLPTICHLLNLMSLLRPFNARLLWMCHGN